MKKIIIYVGMLMLVVSPIINAAPPAQDKLDTRLKTLVDSGSIVAMKYQPELHHDGQKILVSIRLAVKAEMFLDQLEAAGVDIIAYYGGLVSGLVATTDLLSVATMSEVSTISPVEKPVYHAVQGQQVDVLRVPEVWSSPDVGVDGSGVKVGVLSNSFAFFSENNPTHVNQGTEEEPDWVIVEVPDLNDDGIPDLTGTDSQLSGDLPEMIELVREANPWISNGQDISRLIYDDEGRALAEVIYEMAPGCEIAYFGATSGIADFAQGIEELAKVGCQVIVDDYFSAGSPIFQDGEIGLAMAELEEEYDVVFVSACGNFGSAAIDAAYLDSVPGVPDSSQEEMPDGNDFHNWNITLPNSVFPDPFLNITLPPQTQANLYLYWEDPFSGLLGPGASTDYDLFVFTEPEFQEEYVFSASMNVQGTVDSPMGDPYEVAAVINQSTDETKVFYIGVNLKHGAPKNFKLIMQTNPRSGVTLQRDVWSISGSMIIGHPLSKHALSVAAINFLEAESSGQMIGDPRQINPTYYSSRGGVIPILFASDGSALPEPEFRYKPDIASIDGMNTSFFDGSGGDYQFDSDDLPNFLGTSAAAPSAGGLITLMRSANPSLTAEEILVLAKYAATDVHEPGFDFYTGHGLLYADDAVQAAMNPATDIDLWMFFEPEN